MTEPKPKTLEEQATLALHLVIDAWEALPGGKDYRPREIAKWLSDRMSPVINHGRKVLGRPIPKSHTDAVNLTKRASKRDG